MSTEQADPGGVLWRADDPDVCAVQQSFRDAIGCISSALVEPAQALLTRLSSPNWTVEWYLPRWLGEALGLLRETQRALMRSNVFGLAYVRLQDDLADGDIEDHERLTASALAGALHELWLAEYVTLYGRSATFWQHQRRYMAQWIHATATASQPTAAPVSSREGLMALAHRGAPLKIAPMGASILAGRAALIPDLETALDHLLAAAVLIDHMTDWRRDLAAGRYNAFVGYVSSLPQTVANRDANRRKVIEELYVGDAGRCYSALAQEQAAAAQRIAEAIPCAELSAYLGWLGQEAMACSRRLSDQANAHLHTIIEDLFGAPTG